MKWQEIWRGRMNGGPEVLVADERLLRLGWRSREVGKLVDDKLLG
jgi:hypothetical protein